MKTKYIRRKCTLSSEIEILQCLKVLLSERASFGQSSLSTGGLAKDSRARTADNDGLGVREDGGDVEATAALDVHKVRVGRLYETLKLVLGSFGLFRGVEEIDGQLGGTE